MDLKNGVTNIEAAGYNDAHTVDIFGRLITNDLGHCYSVIEKGDVGIPIDMKYDLAHCDIVCM